jgi:hypothetical protein
MPVTISSGVSDTPSVSVNSLADLLPGSAPQAEETKETPSDASEETSKDESVPAVDEKTPGEGEEVEAEDPQAYMKWWRERYPNAPDPFDQYENDVAFFDGLAEKAKLVGQKNEDAQLGKTLRAQGVSEEEIQAYLASRQEKAGGKAKTETPKAAGGVNDLQMLTAQIFDADGNARRDAPKDAVQKYGQIVRDLLQTVYDLKSDPKRFFKDIQDDTIGQVRKEIAGYDANLRTQAAEQAAVDRFRSENPWILDTKTQKLSVQGQQLAQAADQIIADVQKATGAELPLSQALSFALDRLQAKQTTPPPPPSSKAVSRHTRNAVPPPKEATRSGLIAKAGSMAGAIDYAEQNKIDWGSLKP